MKVVSILFRKIVVLLCLVQVRANFSNFLKELRTRSAVYSEAKATCVDRWGEKIDLLKHNIKRDFKLISSHLKGQELNEIAADPAEVAVIVSHLCQTGKFGVNVQSEREWYATHGGEFQPEASVSPGETEATGEDSLGDTTVDTTPAYTSSLRTSSFVVKPIATFIFGLVVGVCFAQCILLKRVGVMGDTVSVHKLRRPEL